MVVVLLLFTGIGSVIACWLLPMAFKSEPPYGLAVDILVGTVLGVAWALLAYVVICPMINLTGALALFGSGLDGIGLGALSLWVLRKIKG